jgi:hypothetical protein
MTEEFSWLQIEGYNICSQPDKERVLDFDWLNAFKSTASNQLYIIHTSNTRRTSISRDVNPSNDVSKNDPD